MSPEKMLAPDLEELFHPINNEVTWLHTIWELYLQLYCATDKNYDIMNSTAPQFFAILQNVLFEQLILIVGRLTDPPTTLGKENASIAMLIEKVKAHDSLQLANSMQKKLDEFRIEHAAFRTWRNKRVNHDDMATLLGKSADLMPEIPRRQAQTAIDQLAGIMNEFSEVLQGSTQIYKPFMVAKGDGNALLQALQMASGLSALEKEA